MRQRSQWLFILSFCVPQQTTGSRSKQQRTTTELQATRRSIVDRCLVWFPLPDRTPLRRDHGLSRTLARVGHARLLRPAHQRMVSDRLLRRYFDLLRCCRCLAATWAVFHREGGLTLIFFFYCRPHQLWRRRLELDEVGQVVVVGRGCVRARLFCVFNSTQALPFLPPFPSSSLPCLFFGSFSFPSLFLFHVARLVWVSPSSSCCFSCGFCLAWVSIASPAPQPLFLTSLAGLSFALLATRLFPLPFPPSSSKAAE